MRDLETPFKLSHHDVLVYDTLEVLLWVLYPKAYSNELKRKSLVIEDTTDGCKGRNIQSYVRRHGSIH